jgi:adenylate kinase
MVTIVISGTPGTGKSELAKTLAKRRGWYRLDLSGHYGEISAGYDDKKQCYIVDIQKIKRIVAKIVKQHPHIIIDSHLAHLLPRKMVDVCIVVLCSDLGKLKRRLEKRNYSTKKVRENLDAEIFQVCLQEAREKKHKVITVDAAQRIDVPALMKKI